MYKVLKLTEYDEQARERRQWAVPWYPGWSVADALEHANNGLLQTVAEGKDQRKPQPPLTLRQTRTRVLKSAGVSSSGQIKVPDTNLISAIWLFYLVSDLICPELVSCRQAASRL